MSADLVQHALTMLKSDADLVADARAGAPIGNSVLGSIMSLTLRAPRWATEDAVCKALGRLDGRKP